MKLAWRAGDGWGVLVSKASKGLTECSGPDSVSLGMCLLQRPITPVLFDLFNLTHLDCLNCLSSVEMLSILPYRTDISHDAFVSSGTDSLFSVCECVYLVFPALWGPNTPTRIVMPVIFDLVGIF